ncbi:hypothetical protein, partial [Staphylococcus pseudintermedius]|uniref:hypothetical protein n=1 Tax=Staphylococcus pseudintermedius TaxID=283734 RepID=UPI001C6E4012
LERDASTSLAIASYAQRERNPWPGFVANPVAKSRHLGTFESPDAARQRMTSQSPIEGYL